MNNIGIYIHIPFCKKKCDYCDFISINKNEDIQNKYTEVLLKSIEHYSKKIDNKKYKVNTIYIGGGTPSFINSENIIKILEKIKESFCVIENSEITIEVNPGTVNKKKIEDYKKVGINRISIGCQAVQNDLLKEIGRIHTFEEFLNSYNIIKNNGFNNINVDLMIGLPNQTLENVYESLEKITNLNPTHISVYSLIVEEQTLIYTKIKNGIMKLPKEELEREMYHKVKSILKEKGYIHYEISNFAKEGFYSKHNMNCWSQKEYLGFGLASHSYFENKRFSNIDDLNFFIKNIEENNFDKNIIIHENQTLEDKKKEYMLLGLRKIDGVSISDFEQKFRVNPLFYFRFEISKLEEMELLEVDLDNIKLTKKGLDFANIVWEEFI